MKAEIVFCLGGAKAPLFLLFSNTYKNISENISEKVDL